MENSRIYVASLAHYVSGSLVGKWFDLVDYSDGLELQQAIGKYISGLTCYGEQCEEWAIHDHESLPFKIGESACCHTFSRLYEALELTQQYDFEAVKAFLDYYGEEELENFENAFVGKYDSELDYAYEFIESCYDLDRLMGNLACYFDYEAFSRDLFIDSYLFLDGYVFNQNW